MPKFGNFIVVLDTNAFYTQNHTELSSSVFEPALENCKDFCNLTLIIPEVVKGERLFQIASHLILKISESKTQLDKVCLSLGEKVPVLPDESLIKTRVETRLNDWATKIGATFHPIPHDRIDWREMIRKSIWRIPPFEKSAGKENDKEKGFRDCLLFETLKEIVPKRGQSTVVLISNDKLLAQTAEAEFPEGFVVYDNIEAFRDYLKGKHEKWSDEFVKKVFERLPKVFFDEGNSECVYIKFKVAEKILTEYSPYLNQIVQEKQTPPLNTLFPMSSTYHPVSDEKMTIGATNMDKVFDDYFLWKTRVRCARLYKLDTKDAYLSVWKKGEMVRVAEFDVLWRAGIDEDANFTLTELEKIAFAEEKQEFDPLAQIQHGFSPLGDIFTRRP
jgi:hypothetical protein